MKAQADQAEVDRAAAEKDLIAAKEETSGNAIKLNQDVEKLREKLTDAKMQVEVGESRQQQLDALWGKALRGAETGAESSKDREARVSGMLQNSDRIYGDGFRDALAAYYATCSSLPATPFMRQVLHSH
jgi:hypothetical protein